MRLGVSLKIIIWFWIGLVIISQRLFCGNNGVQESQNIQLYNIYNSEGIAFPFLAAFADARNLTLETTGLMFGNEAFAAFYNPATLTLLDNEFNFGASYFSGSHSFLSDIPLYPVFINYDMEKIFGGDFGRLCLGFQGTHLDFYDPWSDEFLYQYFERSEFAVLFSYGFRVFHAGGHSIGSGMTMKYFHLDFARYLSFPGEKNLDKNGFAVDFGIAYSYEKKRHNGGYGIKSGLSVANLGPKYKYLSEENKKPLPAYLRFGLNPSYYINYKEIPITTISPQLNISQSLVKTQDYNSWYYSWEEWSERETTVGLEIAVARVLYLRTAFVENLSYSTDHHNYEKTMVYGVGLHFPISASLTTSLDYALAEVLDYSDNYWVLSLVISKE